MKSTKVEVEGGELLLESKEGHYAIIPAKHRQEVMDMIKEDCDDCINSYIQSLPKESNYADDGSLIPNDKTEDKVYHPEADNTFLSKNKSTILKNK